MTTASSVPLSNDDQDVIERTLPSHVTHKTPSDQIEHVYEISHTAQKISTKHYKNVALQFPDELLVDASSVVAALKAEVPEDTALYVLGDTSYGSCCVDEVAAEHVNADALIHYGRSCLSPTNKLPIIYVFGKLPLDLEDIVRKIEVEFPDASHPLLVVSDTTYMSSQPAIAQSLREAGRTHVIETSLNLDTGDEESNNATLHTTLPGRVYLLPDQVSLSEVSLVYIGPPSPTLTTTLMTHASLVANIHSYNPLTSTFQRENSQNIALRRRYAVVQKARDSGVIGIVVGTLGVSKYLELIRHLRTMISSAGKKSYLFAMGKLNPSKMANFAEIDAFVLVACGENSLIESRDFFKPVVTPYELSLALRTKAHDSVPWTGDWITDFEKVLALPEEAAEDVDSDHDEEAPHFSLVTGRYASSSKPMYTALETATDADSAIAKRSEETTVGMVGGLFSPAAQHLQQRAHWGGLGTDKHDAEDDQDNQESSELTQGRRGVARGYD
ncbi:protein of unknown function [Taphrina deformans PYCC 5710]|uniref:2-(3-amino-3-carboxypropyl)histidine synthase subunit 2 n=1 Tax=Taphrina deformans (strain PYCC 5710 / ATCC 11124 / CBS 356.35 / IMI 108563 / JCM 9778 / NBRC 8474) TaxID=1097556 RepID=R4XKH0_TAPDE|nr:protein of unknown function [Taphrina deformans PYCC 5710]|eukprot:CCG84954.1 protein of unknown function [Taphrina deformans PYCC 5710]